MVVNVDIPANQLRESALLQWNDEKCKHLLGFPVIYVDRFSYLSNSKVRTGVGEPGFPNNSYAIHVGAFCSLARYLTFEINENHDYLNITTAQCDLLDYPKTRIKTKGSVLIQNDVWIGQSCTIFGGVTIHNGAVVGSNAVITKDVPPYSIVGGNPARVIKYRFDEDTIKKLLTIQWWNWDNNKLAQRKKWFAANIQDFVDKFYPEALLNNQKHEIQLPDCKEKYLFFPDFDEPFCIWESVILEFCDTFKNSSDTGLVLFIDNDEKSAERLSKISALVQNINADCSVYVHCGDLHDEESIFSCVSYYITSRVRKTIFRTCLADLNNIPIISGVDVPIF
ncbi:MAG TPA: CatB-related O-acetyltransferase [Ruminiclostridium sp.]|nr:CatB-related O-acetyltransferase [Ruminiclostridium sp.]